MEFGLPPVTSVKQKGKFDWVEDLESVDFQALPLLPSVDDLFADIPTASCSTKRPVKKVCRVDASGTLVARAIEQKPHEPVEAEEDFWRWADLDTPAIDEPPQTSHWNLPGEVFVEPSAADSSVWAYAGQLPPGNWAATPNDDSAAEPECLLVTPPAGTNTAEVELVEGTRWQKADERSRALSPPSGSSSAHSTLEDAEGYSSSLEASSSCGVPAVPGARWSLHRQASSSASRRSSEELLGSRERGTARLPELSESNAEEADAGRRSPGAAGALITSPSSRDSAEFDSSTGQVFSTSRPTSPFPADCGSSEEFGSHVSQRLADLSRSSSAVLDAAAEKQISGGSGRILGECLTIVGTRHFSEEQHSDQQEKGASDPPHDDRRLALRSLSSRPPRFGSNSSATTEKRLKDLLQSLGKAKEQPAAKVPLVTASYPRPADLSSRLAEAIHAKIKGSLGQSTSRIGSFFASKAFPRLPSSVEWSTMRILTAGSPRVGTLLPDNVALTLAGPLVDKALVPGRFQTRDSVLRARLFDLVEVVAVNDAERANVLVGLLKEEANPVGSPMQRILFYYLLGLLKRKQGGMSAQEYVRPTAISFAIMQALQEMANSLPLLIFHMDAANNAIQAMMNGEDHLHIVDLTHWPGQWEPLLRSLSERPSGPPFVRITVVEAPPGCPWGAGPSVPPSVLKMQVMRAAAEAGVRCDYHIVTARLEDLTPSLLNLRSEEPLAISACMRLQQLADSTLVASNPRDTFLKKVRSWNPRVLAIGGFELDQNSPFFLTRMREGIDYYLNAFDMLETVVGPNVVARQVFEQVVWAKEILHIAASEGLDRIQREEPLQKWQARLRVCGFTERAFTPAMVESLQNNAARFHPAFTVTEERGALMLRWRGKGVMTAHAWGL